MMNKLARQKVVIIGCGNVAWHLAKHLQSLKWFSVLVYNHKPNPGLVDFESRLKCKTFSELTEIVSDANFYFICVPDKFIRHVSKKINCKNKNSIILHTSGSAKVNEIKNKHQNKGVFYPLQTFSKKDILDWGEIPLILESNNDFTRFSIENFAGQFSLKNIFLSYKQRIKFHLAAVMVNNFTNALYVAASDIIGKPKENLSFELLLPLIKQTTAKLHRLKPRDSQTGPAKRGDTEVMRKHLGLLSKQQDLRKIYLELSDLIKKQQSHA